MGIDILAMLMKYSKHFLALLIPGLKLLNMMALINLEASLGMHLAGKISLKLQPQKTLK